MLRELDSQDRLEDYILSLNILRDNAISPIIAKLPEAIFTAALLYVSILIIYRHFSQFRNGLGHGSDIAIGTSMIILFIIASQALDGIGRRLSEFDISLSSVAITCAMSVEEILELGIPVFMLSVFSAYFRHKEPQRTPHPAGNS